MAAVALVAVNLTGALFVFGLGDFSAAFFFGVDVFFAGVVLATDFAVFALTSLVDFLEVAVFERTVFGADLAGVLFAFEIAVFAVLPTDFDLIALAVGAFFAEDTRFLAGGDFFSDSTAVLLPLAVTETRVFADFRTAVLVGLVFEVFAPLVALCRVFAPTLFGVFFLGSDLDLARTTFPASAFLFFLRLTVLSGTEPVDLGFAADPAFLAEAVVRVFEARVSAVFESEAVFSPCFFGTAFLAVFAETDFSVVDLVFAVFLTVFDF
ncbi:MAG: hypothetical protein R2747_00680 [Pyrinomonadaceae bacterium]